jgi:hypothetical protein
MAGNLKNVLGQLFKDSIRGLQGGLLGSTPTGAEKHRWLRERRAPPTKQGPGQSLATPAALASPSLSLTQGEESRSAPRFNQPTQKGTQIPPSRPARKRKWLSCAPQRHSAGKVIKWRCIQDRVPLPVTTK